MIARASLVSLLLRGVYEIESDCSRRRGVGRSGRLCDLFVVAPARTFGVGNTRRNARLGRWHGQKQIHLGGNPLWTDGDRLRLVHRVEALSFPRGRKPGLLRDPSSKLATSDPHHDRSWRLYRLLGSFQKPGTNEQSHSLLKL